MTARPTRKASVAWILLSSRGKRASRISFSFDTRLSPPLSLPPFIRPFFCRVPRRDVHVPSYPSSSRSPPPFLEEFVLSRKKKRFFFSRCTFVTSFVCFVFRPRTRMITICFLFSWLFIFPSRKTNEMHSSFSP